MRKEPRVRFDYGTKLIETWVKGKVSNRESQNNDNNYKKLCLLFILHIATYLFKKKFEFLYECFSHVTKNLYYVYAR